MTLRLQSLVLVLVVALASDAGSLPAQTLQGRVVHGVDSSGVAGVRVELHRITATTGAVVDSMVSLADGSFEFRLSVDSGSDALWLAAARREGILYFGPARHSGQIKSDAYEVLVFDSVTVTTPPSDLRVGIRHLVITAGPSGGFDVAEVIDVLGSDHLTLVPVPDTLAIWSSSVPENAVDLRAIEGGVTPEAVTFDSGRVLLRSMISPVGARVTFVYSTRSSELEIRLDHPTDRLEVVVAGLEAEVSGASPAGSSFTGGRSIARYTAENLLPGATVRVALARPADAGPQALIWGIVGAGLLLAAGILWATGGNANKRLRSRAALR